MFCQVIFLQNIDHSGVDAAHVQDLKAMANILSHVTLSEYLIRGGHRSLSLAQLPYILLPVCTTASGKELKQLI